MFPAAMSMDGWWRVCISACFLWMKINGCWRGITSQNATIQAFSVSFGPFSDEDEGCPVILVCGPKTVGKSTFNRYLINLLLNRWVPVSLWLVKVSAKLNPVEGGGSFYLCLLFVFRGIVKNFCPSCPWSFLSFISCPLSQHTVSFRCSGPKYVTFQ